jgi:hypothetical protein
MFATSCVCEEWKQQWSSRKRQSGKGTCFIQCAGTQTLRQAQKGSNAIHLLQGLSKA